MAKNKNRKQATQQNRRPQAEEQAQRHSSETQASPMSGPQGSPTDVARKKQKSFGHN